MAKRLHAAVVPKKGKARQVQKRPAMLKSKLWTGVPYVREKNVVGGRGLRKHQTKWKRTLADLLKADNHSIVQLLVRDGLLFDLAGITCPRCGSGSRSKLTKCQHTAWKHKCSSRNCRVWLNPHHLHPLFVDSRGNSAKPLQTQAALLLLLLHRVPQSTIHLLTDINHKAVEDMHLKLCLLRQDYVESKQKKILFGTDRGWADIEADEATFDRRDISNDIHWKYLIKDQEATVLLGYIGKYLLE